MGFLKMESRIQKSLGICENSGFLTMTVYVCNIKLEMSQDVCASPSLQTQLGTDILDTDKHRWWVKGDGHTGSKGKLYRTYCPKLFSTFFLSGFNYLRITFNSFQFNCFTCCYHTCTLGQSVMVPWLLTEHSWGNGLELYCENTHLFVCSYSFWITIAVWGDS